MIQANRVFILLIILTISMTTWSQAKNEFDDPNSQSNTNAPSISHIEIIRTTQIRPELDPDALILKMARAGEIYEVLDVGNIWYTVQTEKGAGYVAQQDCRVVDSNGKPLGGSSFHTLLFALLLFGAMGGGVFFFIRRNREVEFE